MGGEYRTIRVVGKDFNSAWSAEQEIEREEKGSDFYNGSIHHVDDIRMVSESQYDDAINSGVSIYKCSGIAKEVRKPILNTNKIKTTVKNFPQKGTRKWLTKYCVYSDWQESLIARFDNQTDAIKKARDLSGKDGRTYTVHIEKVLDGSDQVAIITYKSSPKERDGEWEVYCLVPW
jgi:hypothetical protein